MFATLSGKVTVDVGDGPVGLGVFSVIPMAITRPMMARASAGQGAGSEGELGEDGEREAGGDGADIADERDLEIRCPYKEGRYDDREEEGDGAEARLPQEDDGEGDGEEADGKRLHLDIARMQYEVEDGKDLDRVPWEFVAGEVPELPEDDQECRSDDEPGEDGVRYEPGQAAGPGETEPELEESDEERQDKSGRTSLSGTGARTEKSDAMTFESITLR